MPPWQSSLVRAQVLNGDNLRSAEVDYTLFFQRVELAADGFKG